jgi:hypothetical protein
MRELYGANEIPQLPMLICLLNHAGPGQVCSLRGFLGLFVALSIFFIESATCVKDIV